MSMTRRDFLHHSAMATAYAGVVSAVGMPQAFAAEQNPLAYMPATEQIKRFKAGTLSPVDVLNAQIHQVKKYNGPLNTTNKVLPDYMNWNGQVNAITYEHFDEAMKDAREAEHRYRAGTARPLEGITVAVKDEYDVAGWRVTLGSFDLADAPLATANSPITEMLRNAGAVLHIQTTIPDYFVNLSTWTKLWGVTRNPWNLEYSAGASSGGSGAALAAGFTTLAIGSDIGGSIRFPSSLAGLYGFKPPLGRVATSEIPYETGGPMARNFEDMALMQQAITGPHPAVQSSLRPKMEYPTKYENLKGVKIAVDYFDSWMPGGVDDEVRQALVNAVEVLRSQGAVVEEVKLGWSNAELYPVYSDVLMGSGMMDMVRAIAKQKDGTPYTLDVLENMEVKDIAKAVELGEALTHRLHIQVQNEIFTKGCIALIMPTVSTPYYPATSGPKDVVMVHGHPMKWFELILTYPWNLLNRYPVVGVPVGVAKNNVPIGMQVIGNTYDDVSAFRVASGYSQAGLRLYSGTAFPDFKTIP